MTDRAGRTDLHYAAEQGELSRVTELLAEGADPNATDIQGFTPLHFAAQSYEPEICVLLIQAGATVDAINGVGNTPLHVTVFNSQGRGEVIELLLTAGADTDQANN
jgi:uncharacterized protein